MTKFRHFLLLVFGCSVVLAYTGTPGSGLLTTDGTSTDVAAALTDAQAGDIVDIPAGTHTWTAGISVTVAANVTLRGAGTTATGGGDVTTIVDDYNSASALLNITVASTGTFRMTGFTLQISDVDPVKENGIIIINGPGTVRVDHMHFDNHTTTGTVKPLWLARGIFGVVHNCIMDFYGNSAIYITNGSGDGGGTQSNIPWAEPTNFGSSNFLFFEDNLYRATTAAPIRIADTWSAARVVWRFNTIQGGAGLEVHETGHSPDDRGTRAAEGYGNSFTALPGQANLPYDMAAITGTMLVWGNDAATDTLKNFFIFNVTRKDDSTYPQSATPTGWGYAGTAFNGTGSNWDGNTDTATGYPALDQVGRGQGDLLDGLFPNKVNDTTGTIAWPNQALEPVYFWANTGVPAPAEGGSYYANNAGTRVQANRDYYAQASGAQTNATTPFNGTTGVGWGTLANRPTTATAGVAYWATDQGNWNKSTSNPYGVQQNGADGVLYKATATDTWTLYYTPYEYPHPLRGESTAGVNVTNFTTTTITIP